MAESRPIVWNRQPIDAQRVALVIRDGQYMGRVDLAWDDGRPDLIGIRSVDPNTGAAAIEAWKLHAELCGAEVRDERQVLTAGSISTREAIARLERERTQRRGLSAPGILFNHEARAERGLFGEG